MYLRYCVHIDTYIYIYKENHKMNRWITLYVFMNKVTVLGLNQNYMYTDKYLHKAIKNNPLEAIGTYYIFYFLPSPLL